MAMHIWMAAAVVLATVAGTGMAALEGGTAKDGTPEQQRILARPLTIQGRAEHPCVYITREDLERARWNREHTAWGKKAAEALIKRADVWAGKSDEEILALVPKEGACFAYGFSSCPLCGAQNSWWGATGCTLADPGHVKCPNGHRMPDAEHPDNGTGWVDKTGKIYYFVGTYNSFVSEQLLGAVNDLAHAYAVTGDDRYGAKGALLLDALAKVYPTCDKGSWDYPSNPPSGRFNRPWYQVARTLVQYTDDYDLLLGLGKDLERPSLAKGMTRRENIEKNLILNGARYCFEQSVLHPSLNNGQCDYIRGTLVAGVALGIPEYVAWGVDGPTGIRKMIENNVDRDGQYYETSQGYSHHSRYLYVDTAEILDHYTDAKYPQGIHLGREAKLRAFCLLPQSRTQVAGLQPTLGDDAPNLKKGTGKLPEMDDVAYLHHLYAMQDAAGKKQIGELLTEAVPDLEKARGEAKNGEWLLFHAENVGEGGKSETAKGEGAKIVHPLSGVALGQSDLLNQRGLAILRSATGAAVTMRAGPTLNHGHLDELNLNVYAYGQDLTYDLGYGLGSTHTQVGWSHQTASHNTVLVDEKSQLGEAVAGGCVTAFYGGKDVQVATAEDANAYAGEKVTAYERTLALIDSGEKSAYVVDFFHVAGGMQHDYVFHSRGTEMTTNSEMGEPGAGSMAGKDAAWGEKIGPDGDVIGVANRPYWNPPPGNGLGFLMHPRMAQVGANAGEVFAATWRVDAETGLRLTMAWEEGTRYVTATAPGILPGKFPKAAYVFARRGGGSQNAGLESMFAGMIEPFEGETKIKRVERAKTTGEGAALRIELAGGRVDYVMHGKVQGEIGGQKIACGGGTAVVRMEANGTTRATMVACPNVKVGDMEVETTAAVAGNIETVDYEKSELRTSAPLPAGEKMRGAFIVISNPAYTRPTTYRIAGVRNDGGKSVIELGGTSMVLARGHMEQGPGNGTLPNVVPLEYAKCVSREGTRFFDGKVVESGDGKARTILRSVEGKTGTTMSVESADAFKAGDDLVVYDVRPGDSFAIPTHAEVEISQDGRATVSGITQVRAFVKGRGR